MFPQRFHRVREFHRFQNLKSTHTTWKNNTYYDVVLRAENKFGWSPYSQVFTFQTLEKDKATMKLQDQQIIPLFEGQGKKVLFSLMNKHTRVYEYLT